MSEKFKINRFVHYVGVNDRKTHLLKISGLCLWVFRTTPIWLLEKK